VEGLKAAYGPWSLEYGSKILVGWMKWRSDLGVCGRKI